MKYISTTFPWDLGLPEETVRHAKALGCENVCIRTPNGPFPYGVDDETRQRWQGNTHDDLEIAVKRAGLTLSLWPVAYFRLWKKEADAIKTAISKYNPTAIFLDAERKENIKNLGSFLRELGRLPRPLYLQSFRRANFHPEFQWRKWYSYRDLTTGEFIVDGFGHQLYPIGWKTKQQWLDQFKKDVESHEREAKAAGRQDLPWFPTMPTFISGGFESVSGWRPDPEAFMAAVEWMVDHLGERLIGLNFWSLDRHLVKLPELYQAISEWELPGSSAPVDTTVETDDESTGVPGTLDQPEGGEEEQPGDGEDTEAAAASLEKWANQMDAWARRRGYNGPPPPKA